MPIQELVASYSIAELNDDAVNCLSRPGSERHGITR
jgi:hypothetical protein